ncbi:MAG: cbb3-type cytochrome c oxidase subunit I [Isosphaeraceae bacterium]
MEKELPRHEDLVDDRLVYWHFMAALIFMGASMLGGLLMALQLLRLDPFTGIELLSPGRWRMIHTNAIAYGFIANAFLGGLQWIVPRLTLRKVYNPTIPVLNIGLSWAIFWAWQLVVGATAVGLILGQAQAVEWGETPTWIDPVAQLGLLLVAINYIPPIAKVEGPLYVSLWYFLAAFVWTFLTYAMGNFMPQYFVSGTAAGAVGGLFIHDLVGLFVTPLGWGLMYYFVPILLKKPIWSHGLSLVGFWGLAFFYPLQGIHHFLYTPIPMFLQYGAVISTIALELVVASVIFNFHATLRGSTGALTTNLPIRWFYSGMFYYFLTCLQCAFQVTLTFQQLIHFTDWVVGHAHMVMFGVFIMWQLGMMTYLIPRLLKTPWYSQRLLEWHYWLSFVGVGLMSFDLIILGIFQGLSWSSLLPWEHSLDLSIPFWAVRTVAGLLMIAGYLVFVVNIVQTYLTSRPAPQEAAVATA